MRKTFFARYSWPILGVVALLTPWLLYGAFLAVKSNVNRVEDWLPSTFKETTELNWFRRHFVADRFVVVSWDGCVLGGDPSLPESAPDDPRIELLARKLVATQRAAGEDGEAAPIPVEPQYARYFKSVTTARRTLNDLTSGPAGLSYTEAVKRITGSLVGLDGKHTSIVVTLTDEGARNLRDAIGHGHVGLLRVHRKPGVLFTAMQDVGIEFDSVHMGGPPVDNVAIDEEGERTLVRLSGLAGIVGLGLAWWSLRSVRLTALVFACGILSGALGLSIVWISGESMDTILMSMPSLVYVLAISGAVHVINYYRDATEHGLEGAPERAVAHAWRPALLCSVTTAIGLASLYVSDLAPIRKFGVYSAAAALCELPVLFLYLPAALQVWPMRRKANEPEAQKTSHITTASFAWFDWLWLRWGSWVIRHHAFVLLGCVAFIGVVGSGVARTKTTIDLLKLFDRNSRIIQDYTWLEQHVGRLVPMEIVLRFPKGVQEPIKEQTAETAAVEKPINEIGRLTFLERLEAVNVVQVKIDERFGSKGSNIVGRTMAATSFSPKLPPPSTSVAARAQRTGTNLRLEASREAFEKGGYLQTDPVDGAELCRISVRVAAFEDVDYGQFAEELRETIDPVIGAYRRRHEVIREVASQNDKHVFVNKKVAIWLPGWDKAVENVVHSTDPDVIFADTLVELLQKAQIGVKAYALNPAEVSLSQMEALKGFDCVVLAGDFSDSDIALVEQVGVPVLDARHGYGYDYDDDALHATRVDDVSAIYTGVVPIVYKAQRALLESLIQSTIWSFATILPLMMFVSRGFAAGLVVMVPNVLPVLVVFGGMGWLGISVDIGCMMSASIALGVAVDDTIHFMAWFREDLKQLGDRSKAILAAYRRCATPTLQAALISGFGMSVFALSTFTPTQRFGWLMLTILVAGVVAELVMLPALLAGPFGAAFHLKSKSAPAAEPTTSAPPKPHTDRPQALLEKRDSKSLRTSPGMHL